MFSDLIYHGCLALSAFSKDYLSEFSEFERSLMSDLIKILKVTVCHRKELIILEIYNKYKKLRRPKNVGFFNQISEMKQRV